MNNIRTVRDILSYSREIYPARTAFLQADGKEITYEEFARDVDALAIALKEKLKLNKSHVGIMSANSYWWCVAYFAIASGEGVIVPLDKDNTGENSAGLIEFGEVKAVICDRASALALRKSNAECILICTGETELEGVISLDELLTYGKERIREGIEIIPQKDPDEMAVLLFTSGTTGTSKGVMLSNNNIISDLKAVSGVVTVTNEDRSLSVLPLHHTYEAITMLMMIKSGATICFASSYKNLLRDFSVYRPTILVCVPLLLEKFERKIQKEIQLRGKSGQSKLASIMSGVMSEDSRRKVFSSVHDVFGGRLRKIIVGAAPVKKSTAEAFETYGFSVIIGYGLTECSPIVICNSELGRRTDSIGKPVKGVQVKITDADEKGVGEITVRGPMVMKGYYKNPGATDGVFRDGWFCTGDLGYEDKDGFFHITGRRKNVIVTDGGKNIYPEEIEQYLMKSPLVSECVVYGGRNNEVLAELFPDEEEVKWKSKKAFPDEREIYLYMDAVVKTVNRKLPPYKRIRSFTVRSAPFEKTTTHKIKR